MPITAMRNGLHCQIGRAESCGFHNLPNEEIEANGGLIAEGRNAMPRLLAIAQAAEEAVSLREEFMTAMTAAFWQAMDRLRAALDSRADAAPAVGDGSIGGVEQADTAIVTEPRSLSPLNSTGEIL